MINIMLDLETMGNSSNAAIISIGAAEFGKEGIGKNFYSKIKLQSCIDAGLTMDSSTVLWWMKQSDAARKEFEGNEKEKSLIEVLKDFSKFITWDSIIWGNGSDFDNVILANAYRATGLKQPWKYGNNRCYRTLKAMFPEVAKVSAGTAHNALDDAVAQAQHACIIISKLKEGAI